MRPPQREVKFSDNFLRGLYSQSGKYHITGDFRLSVLDYNNNDTVKKVINTTFEYGLLSVINRPTRVTRNSATAIHHIIAYSLIYSIVETGIIRTCIFLPFPIFIHREVSVFGVFLVRIQSECGKIRARKTPSKDAFHAGSLPINVNKFKTICKGK